MKFRLENWASKSRKAVVIHQGRVALWCGLSWKTWHWFCGNPDGWCFYSWHTRFPIGRAVLLAVTSSALTYLGRSQP